MSDQRLETSKTLPKVWESDDPFARSPESQAQMDRVKLSRDLLAGTQAMRDAGERYLPRYAMEEPQDWETRRDRTFLDPLYEETIAEHVGRVFEEPLAINPDLPDVVKEWLENVDGEGSSIHTFAQRAFSDAISDGAIYGLVDQQAIGAASLAEARSSGMRPLAFSLRIDTVLGWRYRFNESGEISLEQVRVLDTIEVAEGAYGRRLDDRVIVYEPGEYSTYERKSSDGEAIPIEGGDGELAVDLVPVIPFVGGLWLSPFEAHPYFRKMADAMVEHWQKSSDQNHALSYVIRLLWHFAGVTEKEFGAIQSLGSNLKFRTSAKPGDAAVTVVEPTGRGVELNQSALERLEAKLHRMSRRPLLTRPSGSLTATEAAIQTAIMQSSLRDLAIRFESWINRMISLMAAFQNLEIEKDAVTLPRSFALQSESEEIRLLDDLGFDRELIFEEIKRRDIIDDRWTLEDAYPDGVERKKISVPVPAQPAQEPPVTDQGVENE